jgi:hypothetical protein
VVIIPARRFATLRGPAKPGLARIALLVTLLAACGSFQDPDVVVDLRVLALDANVPEQVIDLDLKNPPPPAQLLSQLVPAQVCALIADPAFDRRLRWSMTLCQQRTNERCKGSPQTVIGGGVIDDPDTTVPEPQLCATVQPDDDLLATVLAALKADSFNGLQGIDYEVMLRVGGEDADPALDQYAAKALQVTARVPADRTPNQNPSLLEIEAAVADGTPVPLPLGRCVDQASPLTVPSGAKVRLLPIEPAGARETYTLPTIDGGFETFTESLTYQWVAGDGKFSSGSTGGPRDVFGNPAPLFTDWTAPKVTAPEAVPLWIVQRDERLGVHWYESCALVTP